MKNVFYAVDMVNGILGKGDTIPDAFIFLGKDLSSRLSNGNYKGIRLIVAVVPKDATKEDNIRVYLTGGYIESGRVKALHYDGKEIRDYIASGKQFLLITDKGA